MWLVDQVLCVVPAKASSTRIPGKNLRPLGGVPLFLWTVRAAIEADIGPVVVSTDRGDAGETIARLALAEGAIVVHRPAELCRDPAEAPDAVLHALGHLRARTRLRPSSVCMLLPTSPFRTAAQIREAVRLHQGTAERPNVVSVGQALRSAFHHKLCLVAGDGAIYFGPPLRDTALANTSVVRDGVLLNGAIWIAATDRLESDRHFSAIGALPYLMDEESGLDIDTEHDFSVARLIAARRTGRAEAVA